MTRNRLNLATLLILALSAPISLTVSAQSLPQDPDASVPAKNYITAVNPDLTITYRLYAPAAEHVDVVTGATPVTYIPHQMTKDDKGVWSWTSAAQ